MAVEKKAKLVRITSPKGIAKYPWLSRPDVQFNTDGVFKVNLLIPEAEAVGLCSALDNAAAAALADAKAKAKNPALAKAITLAPPYSKAVDDAGEETGDIEFKFKMNARVTFSDGKTRDMKPAFFDAKGKAMEECPNVYGGSVLKVNFSPAPYYAASSKSAGVSLRINAVQIIELVTGGGGTATGFGFAEEADGFDSDTLQSTGGTVASEGSSDF
jgi:hypothetical protein